MRPRVGAEGGEVSDERPRTLQEHLLALRERNRVIEERYELGKADDLVHVSHAREKAWARTIRQDLRSMLSDEQQLANALVQAAQHIDTLRTELQSLRSKMAPGREIAIVSEAQYKREQRAMDAELEAQRRIAQAGRSARGGG